MRPKNYRTIGMRVWLFLICVAALPLGCREEPNHPFVIALGDNIRTIDPLGSPSVDAASERVRVLMFNSLVTKDDKFEYIGDLASNIEPSEDNLTFTFPLRDGIRFHDGHPFSSADAKYTLDLVLSNPHFAKSTGFSDSDGKSYIKSVEAPDPRTVVVTTTRPWTGLLSNLVAIPIIPKDSYPQKDHPVGTGPFKFKSYDSSKQVLDVEANQDYWDGPPTIHTLRVRVIADMNLLQADLRSGGVDIAPLPTSLSPDAIKLLEKDPNLQVVRYTGSNINLLTFNTAEVPLNNVRVRQAIAYAIDRESIIHDLILDQARIAHSILPRESWAYSPGEIYPFDPSRAKQLLDEAGLKDPDGDGPQMRFAEPLVLKVSGSSPASKNCAGQIQQYLKNVGMPVDIQIAELNTLLEELPLGKFQIFLGQWVGGNQDPVFYKDLTATSKIPTPTRPGRNRSRYSNKKLDDLIDQAMNTFDHEQAKGLYAQIQDIVSREVPIFPLYYQANIAIAKKNVGNIKVDASGNWSFVKNLTVQKEDR